MAVETRQLDGGVSVVTISGRLALGGETEKLDAAVSKLIEQHQKKVVLDITALDYADSSGIGTLVSFSTQPGNVALDGDGRNSPFAGAVVKQLSLQDADIGDMLIRVRNDVIAATRGRQVPWEHSALTAKFYSEPVHVRQWAAFVRRIGEPALANEFSRVVADLTEFLMPAAKAAATSIGYPVSWEPLGPWQHGRSSKI